MYHLRTSVFHLPSEKGDPHAWLRASVNMIRNNQRGTHQMTHSGQVFLVQLEPMPNSHCPQQMGLGRNTKRFRDHGMSQSRVWKSMNKQQGRLKMLKGILKNRMHQRGLDSKHDFISPRKQDDLSIRWPFIISPVCSAGCRGARLM